MKTLSDKKVEVTYDNCRLLCGWSMYLQNSLRASIERIKSKIKHQSLNGDGSLISGLCSNDIDKVIKILNEEFGENLI